jgi:RNA polymerase sigma factor (sigma-70 family)
MGRPPASMSKPASVAPLTQPGTTFGADTSSKYHDGAAFWPLARVTLHSTASSAATKIVIDRVRGVVAMSALEAAPLLICSPRPIAETAVSCHNPASMGGAADDPEIDTLVRKYSRLVRAVAARVGGALGRQIAEDVEQEVFVNIWKQLDREQLITNPSSYIYRCAVRETIRLLKAERQTETLDDVIAEVTPDAASTPDAIKALPIDRRRAVQAYLSGFSVPEVMQMYGWSYERARNLSTRGMADLRALLKERQIDG